MNFNKSQLIMLYKVFIANNNKNGAWNTYYERTAIHACRLKSGSDLHDLTAIFLSLPLQFPFQSPDHHKTFSFVLHLNFLKQINQPNLPFPFSSLISLLAISPLDSFSQFSPKNQLLCYPILHPFK